MFNFNIVPQIFKNTMHSFYLSGSSLNPCDAKIASFLGYAGATSQVVVAQALMWREEITRAGFSSIDAFPGDDGEILVSGIQGGYTFEAIIENDSAMTVSFTFDDKAIISLSRAENAIAAQALQEAASTLWTLSGGLSAINMIPEKSALPKLHSASHPDQKAVCP